MDNYQKVGFTCLAIVAGLYIIAMLYGLLAAFPFGLVGLVAVVGIGALLIKVIRERLQNKEDDYYSNKVEK